MDPPPGPTQKALLPSHQWNRLWFDLFIRTARAEVGSSREAASLGPREALRCCLSFLPEVSVHRRLLPWHDVASSDMKVDVIEGSLQEPPLTWWFIAGCLEGEHSQGLMADSRWNECMLYNKSSFPKKVCWKVGKILQIEGEKSLIFSFAKTWKSSLFSLFSRKGKGLGRSQCDLAFWMT